MNFLQGISEDILKKNSRLLVGLDPQWDLLPPSLRQEGLSLYGSTLQAGAWAIGQFCEGVMEVTEDLAVGVKIQLAFFELFGAPGYESYTKMIGLAKERGLWVIADGKRGDIGSSSEGYAKAHLGSFFLGDQELSPAGADALTLHPYLGGDGLHPFLQEAHPRGKGVFVLVRTSNPSSGEVQLWPDSQNSLYEHLLNLLSEWADQYIDSKSGLSSLGVVAGATYPEALAGIRAKLPRSLLLLPGFGHQGGKAEDLRAGFLAGGQGALVNSSRGILYAFKGEDDWKGEIRQAAQEARDAINGAVL